MCVCRGGGGGGGVAMNVRQGGITKCDSSVYYRVRQGVITKCDSYFITKCDKRYYKVRQVLQSATSVIAKCDRYYKVRRYYKV